MRLLKLPLALITVAALAACTTGTPNIPVPSVTELGADLHCGSDHGYEDLQAGWGFCYPATWKYLPHTQNSVSPPGQDSTFDITDASPCTTPAAGEHPSCPPTRGLFAFMIISTYDRAGSKTLSDWVAKNETSTFIDSFKNPTAISWGNSSEALVFGTDNVRMALTPHHVIVMELRSGEGNLNLEAAMSSRLASWKFSY